ncbi:TonB-dependent receptor [Paremcibacter congregatus]|uniref:TonB-dependent receptor n=1 Tax=Paremcibacter congregatus TaxID=2043170 RepID=A0A2G4YRB7_9PROT|nr:TonB-dependent receptor [Paremcibacter congregatus]PHZ84827.1 TonB-dependent receptor [Paremcibacter congregatus]QDE26200.1 TonB-dependent receptor [Paremcibacter congregatus]
MRSRKSILLGSVGALVVMSGPAAISAASAQEEVTELEEVVVTGIRGGLKQALNVKRNSNAIVDVISSEDIGKFPDKNVAESLQRVTGVAIARQFGEGAGVAIRGASQNMTLTLLNGQNVASTGWFVLEPARRSFNYSLLPSELVGNIEVYKSAQANIAEGGIGGTVIIHTRKPLEMNDLSVYASAEGTHTNDSGKINPQLSGLVSWKNEQGNLGVLVSGVYQRRQMERQGDEAFWAWGAGPVAFEQDRKRSAINATVQFQPNENLDLTVNYLRMKMRADNTNYALFLTRGPDAGTTKSLNGSPVAGALNVGFYQARPREATMNSNVYDFDATYSGDDFVVDFQAGLTESTGGTDFEMVLNDGTVPDISGSTYDFSSGHMKWNLNEIGFDWDPGTLDMGTGSNFNRTPKSDKEHYAQFDVSRDVSWGPITTYKFGMKYSGHDTKSRRYEYIQAEGFNPSFATSTINNGLIKAGVDQHEILRIDFNAAKDLAKASIIGETEDLGAYSELDEKTVAAYGMVEFEGDGYRGNAGVRYTHTSATSTFYVNGEQRTQNAKDSQFLPSFNIAMDLADDLVLRTSGARVMTRPQYVDLYVNPDVRGANDDVDDNQFWIVGNIGLKPFISDQFDIALEWYFAEGSILSSTVFMKDVKNFVSQNERHANNSEIPFNGTIRPEEAAEGWTFQERINGKAATIKGVELQYQQDFGNGFGLVLNYTYTDSGSDDADTFTDGQKVLSDASKHSANATAYYESERFQVRGAYNYRSAYMLRETGAYGNRLHEAFGSVDLSAAYFITDEITVNLDVNNLFEETSKQIGNNAQNTPNSGFTPDFPVFEYNTARRITLGVSYKF